MLLCKASTARSTTGTKLHRATAWCAAGKNSNGCSVAAHSSSWRRTAPSKNSIVTRCCLPAPGFWSYILDNIKKWLLARRWSEKANPAVAQGSFVQKSNLLVNTWASASRAFSKLRSKVAHCSSDKSEPTSASKSAYARSARSAKCCM